MFKSTFTGHDKVRYLERIVMDNDIGKGLGITNRWNGNGVQRLALKSIAEIGGDGAIKSLKRIISDPCVNGELEIYASKLLEVLASNKRGKKLIEK